MAENSAIEWCHHTHNEWIGCTKVSAGCANCYAEALMDTRYGKVKWGKGKLRQLTSEANRRKPFGWDRAAAKAGERHRVFTCSLADVFDEEVSDEWRVELFARIFLTPHLDWLVLTKRAEKMRAWITAPSTAGLVQARAFEIDPAAARVRKIRERAWDIQDSHPGPGDPAAREAIAKWFLAHVIQWPLPNVWLGVSVEHQARADERIPVLLQTPASVRFLSVEPMIGPVDLRPWVHAFDPDHEEDSAPCCQTPRGLLHWVIVGSESGTRRRPMDEAWARSIRDQCTAASVPFFFKQAVRDGKLESLPQLDGKSWAEFPGSAP